MTRVIVYTPTGEVTKLFVIDGMTRTKYAADHKDNPPASAPNVNFNTIRVVDITSGILKDPKIVLPQERQGNQQALTLLQYLRAVVPHTIVHSEIADRRIAGHLINAWNRMVGPDLTGKFPAIAALSFVGNDKIPAATNDSLRKELDKIPALIVNETPDDRKKLDKGLLDIASIISQSKLIRQDVAREAFLLVGSGSLVIGGNQERTRQVFAWARSLAVEKKLAKDFGSQKGEAENARLDLARAVESALVKFSVGTLEDERNQRDLQSALSDENLTIIQTIDVLTAPSPSVRFSEIKRNINKQMLREEYIRSVKRQALSGNERVIIDNIGGQTYLNRGEIPSIISDIQFTVALLRQSEEWANSALQEKDSYIQRGVKPKTIDDSVALMTQRQNALLATESLASLKDRVKELRDTFTQSKDEFAKEILEAGISKRVDQMLGKKMAASKDPFLKKKIVSTLMADPDIKDLSNPQELNRWLLEFGGLDSDLQTEITSGYMRLAAAIRAHRHRRVQQTPTTSPTVDTVPTQSSTIVPAVRNNVPNIDALRIQRNIERLRTEIIEAHLIPAIGLFNTIDLNTQEVPPDIKTVLGELETLAERLRSGHLNVIAVMDDHYPHATGEIQRLNSLLLQRDQEEAAKNTRTGR